MFNLLRLFCRLLLILLIGAIPFKTFAQQFTGVPQQVDPPESVKQVLKAWTVYQLDATAIKQFIHETPEATPIQMQLGDVVMSLQLIPSNILAPNYTLQVLSDDGLEKYPRSDHRAFKGIETNTGGAVRLTFDKNFIHGYVQYGSEKYFIEPLWYHMPDAARDLFLFYPESAVIKDQDVTCIELAGNEDLSHIKYDVEENGTESSACYELEIAIASDKSMHTKYGSVGAVEAHNIAVINDVQGLYTGNFNHDIEFVIVTQFVVTGTDPWTSSTDAGTLLASFRTWGNNNGFGVDFDNGELWTNRNFDGSTVGIAYLGGICNSNKYHCLQDFTSNALLLRGMTAHEIGHNFTATHDGTGACPPNYVMCPFVNTSPDWSSNSQSQINGYMTTKINSGCLEPCGGGPPLSADFDWSPNPACEDNPVQFTDMSSGPISGRTWTFPGGSPATSTATNPIVTWFTPGSYTVMLTLSGVGGPVSTSKVVIVEPNPVSNFSYTFNDLTYSFTSTSTNAVSYFWDFGDGLGFSTQQNPIYTYSESGIYTVKLTVENNCGTSVKTALINTIPTANFSADPTNGCATMTVQFTNESSSNSSSYLWQFPGGQPASSNLPNPIVIYTTSGMHNVTLTAYNGSGSNSITYQNYIKVQNIPSANFTKTIDSLTVTFTNSSFGATSYVWEFGDGDTSHVQHPVHTYASGGTYVVTLTSTNACGSTTATQTIVLIAPPSASFTATPTTGCAPLTVQFTNTSGGNPTSLSWTFPGGNPGSSTASNPSVTYNTPGTYTVTLIAANSQGADTLTLNNFITVNTIPAANFTAAVNLDTVQFTNTSTGASSYNWSFGDGDTSTSANPLHVYDEDGIYTVTLISTNACGADTVSQTVTIVTIPTASFTATPTSGCGPLTVQFTSTSSANATNFNWSFPGGNPSSSSSENPTVVYDTPGTYSVTLTVSNSAGSDTATQTNYITVNPGPTAGYTSATSGFTATFTNTSTNSTTYSWDFGDGNSSTETDPEHTYDEDGTYTVVLTATNVCGTNTFTQTVTIVTPPTANFSATPTSGCGPLTVLFTNTSSTNATNFNWSFPGGAPTSSTLENPTVVYNAAGSYTVTLIASNAAGSDTVTFTNYVTVNPGPAAGFTSSTSGFTATFINTSANSTSYNWNFGDGNSSTDPNPEHTYNADGTYTVTLIATNACGSDTITQSVTILTPPTAGFTATPTTGCDPLTVQFTNTSSPNATTFNWSFPGGTPSSSTAQNPLVTYNAPGSYTVTLIAGNAAGSDTITLTNFVTVNPGPTAGFTSTTSGATATFTNTTTNGTSYSWDFGDGNSSTESDPEHTYDEDGTYTVVLTATNACGTSTFTQNVVIITSPTAGFTANKTIGCGPLTVQFIDLSSGNTTSWEWTFEGGTPATSTEQNPTVVYNTPGVYDVTLVASNPAGTTTFTQPDFITVLAPPTAGFTSTVNGPTVNFTNNSQNASSYLWNFGDNSTSSMANPSHTYSAEGTYTVTLTATNQCGSATTTGTVTVIFPPQASFIPIPSEGCAPLQVKFTNTSSASATSFQWTFEGGTPASSTEPEPTVVFNDPGVYTVTLIASNSAGSSTATSTVTVLGPPTADFTFQTAGLSVILTNTTVNGESYFWDFGDGNNSNETNPTHTYVSPGTYTISLQALNPCGATTISQTIEIQGSAPIPAFTASENMGCVPLTVQFTDQSVGNPTAWLWAFPGGNPLSSTAQNPTVVYSTPGVYNVTLTVTNAFGSNTSTQTGFIEVMPLPSASFAYVIDQQTVSFENLSQNGINYSWNFGDGKTSTEQSPTHTYDAPGTYTVELTVINNCGASTLQQMITLISGTGEVAWLDEFRLYPNPSTGVFTVEMTGSAQNKLEFVLYNAIGQLVERQTADFGTGTLKRNFDYSTQPAGMYTLSIRSGVSAMQVKIAIQR